MYPGELGKKYADRPAFIMASTGKEVTYAEFESRANQLAHYLRSINPVSYTHLTLPTSPKV